jgi:hypothetical protein
VFSRSLSELPSEQKSEVTYLGVGGEDHLIVCLHSEAAFFFFFFFFFFFQLIYLLPPLPPPAKYLLLGILEWDP